MPLVIVPSTLDAVETSLSGTYGKYIINIENIPSPTYGKVFAIHRDHTGYLWFGTTNGLYRYDGNEVRVFDVDPDRSHPEQFITSIIQYGDTALLLGTWGGLRLFDLINERVVPFLNTVSFGDGRIEALVQDARDRIWIGTRTAGVFCYDAERDSVRRFVATDPEVSTRVIRLMVDHAGIVWVGTFNGLFTLDPESGTMTRCRPGAPNPLSHEIWALDEDESGRIMVGTRGGLFVIDRSAMALRRVPFAGVHNAAINAIAHSSSRMLWFGVLGKGVSARIDDTVIQFPSLSERKEGISDPYANVLYVDPTSDREKLLLWIGTRGAGVDKLTMHRNPFTNFSRDGNLPIHGNGAILTLCRTADTTMWLGLWGGGLNAMRFSGETYSLAAHYHHNEADPASLPDNTVTCLHEDRAGTLWVGTEAGLAALRPGRQRFDIYRHRDGDPHTQAGDVTWSFLEDGAGRLWVCTREGVSWCNVRPPEQRRIFASPAVPAIPGRGATVTGVAADGAGRIWLLLAEGGLYSPDPPRMIIDSVDTNTTAQRIRWYGIHKDRQGLFWLSTTAGMKTFDPATGQLTSIESSDLQGAHIHDIADDAEGTLWLSTAIGLVRYDRQSGTYKRYSESQGLAFRELMSEFFHDQDGRLSVGGLDGFVSFHPTEVTTYRRPPTVVLTGLSIFGKVAEPSLLHARSLALPYDQNSLSFSFAALDYVDPERNRYAYRMTGIDAGWTSSGHRHFANYTNVEPGTYRFEVRGTNSDDVWSETEASLVITIVPPYWRTWWFRGVSVVLLIAVVYAVYRYRMRKLLELERLRFGIASDLHDDVGSNLSAIAMASRSVQRSPELSGRTRAKIAEIYDTAVLTSERMKDIVWFIRPENDTLDDLFLRMRDVASTMLDEMEVGFSAPRVGDSFVCPIHFKRSVFLAFKEIVTNIAKHAAATRATIDIGLREREINMTVADNGRGFDVAGRHRGTGMASLQRRARDIGGTCTVTSVPGGGTTVMFTGRIRA